MCLDNDYETNVMDTTNKDNNKDNNDNKVSKLQPRVLFETQCLFRLLANLNSNLLNEKDQSGQSPFMMVCLWGNLDLIFYFLQEHYSAVFHQMHVER